MFKIGDEVICVNIIANGNNINLKLYEKYIITSLSSVDVTMYVGVNDDEPEYFATRFKLLSEIRREKLNRLCLKKAIK